MEILEHFDLKNFNTFHVSAFARYFADVTEIEHLQQALDFCRDKDIPFMLIGQGSNLLFREDYPGLVIEMDIKGIDVLNRTDNEVDIRAMCGENWHQFVLYCLDHHYYGLENLSLIPGTIGAAPVQNIGAYGVEVSEYLLELEALEIATGELVTFRNEQCSFTYRGSIFKGAKRDQYIICHVTFRLKLKPDVNISYSSLNKALQHVPAEQISPRMVSETVCAIRSAKMPDHQSLGNAGSFFWNPVLDKADFEALQEQFPDIVGYPEQEGIKVPAAWLIEKAGWKGYRTGDVGVHKEHALVLVNYGKASGAQLYDLSVQIQASVKKMFGIELSPEVRII
ncbi:MAG: UDP-N-acetylmuramate dehydrogenase [Pseudohongiellaceae bacterium]